MNYTEDGYAAMLLTMALSPDREEYARPLSTQEFRAIERAVKPSRYRRLGKLLDADVSGLMMELSLTEQEGLRLYTLLHRSMQLTYALEGYERGGLHVVTCYDDDYPSKLVKKLGEQSPVFYYQCGDQTLMNKPAIAIVGIGGVRTGDDVRKSVETLVIQAARHGYAIVTGGEPGVSRAAAAVADTCGGAIIDVLGGDMQEYIHTDGIAERIAMGRALSLSLVHPKTMFTVPHAAARNRLLFALADAAFIFNTDGRRGELGILQNRTCRNVYAWNALPANHPLIAHGATAFGAKSKLDFDEMTIRWSAGNAEQLSMFDLL